MKTSEIKIAVSLDENNHPSKIIWNAPGNDGLQTRESKAMLLSFFDKETLETFKIDLWTNDLQIVEMDRLMFNTLKALTESYFKATQNQELANQMRSFVQHFGRETKIINPE